MAKKKSPYDDLHLVNMAKYQKSIDTLWSHTADEASKLGIETGFENGGEGEHFSFDNYPKSRKKMNDLLWRMREDMQRVVDSGIQKEWDLANTKNAEMVERLTKGTNVPKDVLESMQPHNGDALEAFQFRKIRGLSLSDRVWNITEQFDSEVETAIEVALAKGKSAADLSRDVRKLLKEPNMMYRRYREKDKNGNWVKYWRRKIVDPDGTVHFVKQPLAHTGMGVYRSSYKNAMRMARTETNMAYHKADNEFYRQSPFVLGFKVILSNNHTCNGVPIYDICDMFAGKEFPVDFDFPGWHPMCRCVTVPITPKHDEVVDYIKKIANDEDVSGYQFNGRVNGLPKEFTDWVADNEDRLIRMQGKGTLPYFIKQNIADGYKFGMGFSFQDGLKWSGNKFVTEDLGNGITSFSMESVPRGKTPEELALEADFAQYSPEIQANLKEIERRLGQKRGLSMSYEEADRHKENPLYITKRGYQVNCQTCTVTHELRRRGFNVEAFENNDHGNRVWKIYDKYNIGHSNGRWLNQDGTVAKRYYAYEWMGKKGYSKMSKGRVMEYFNDMMRNDGRFEIHAEWKGKGAHVFLAERKNGVIKFFDPQSGKGDIIDNYISCAKMDRFAVVRIDNKLIRPELAETFVAKGELPVKIMSKEARIDAIAAARHAARTNERAKELTEFWENKKAEGNARRNKERIDAIAAKRHAERDEQAIRDAAAKRVAEHTAMRTKIVDAADKVIKDGWVDASEANNLLQTGPKGYLYHLYEFAKKADEIESKLAKMEPYRVKYNDLMKYDSKFVSYKANVERAKTMIVGGDFSGGEKLLDELKQFKSAEDKYNDINSYAVARHKASAKSPTKIETAIQKAKDLLDEGKVTDAMKFLDDAENTRRINEASLAAKKAQREAAKKAKEEAEKKAKEEEKKIAFDKVKTKEDLEKAFGGNVPKTLEEYFDALDKYPALSAELKKHEAEIEGWFKDLVERSDYGMAIDYDLLDSVMKNGFYNTFQSGSSHGYNGSTKTTGKIERDHSRLTLSHLMYTPSKKGGITGRCYDGEQFARKEYEKYGHLLCKDKKKAFKEQTVSYGDVQIRFKKDKVCPTITFGDTLNKWYGNDKYLQPTLASDPKIHSFDERVKSLKKSDFESPVTLRDNPTTIDPGWHKRTEYIELQYHGDVTADCVESMVFNTNPESLISKESLKKWYEKGVDVYYYDRKKDEVVLYKKGKPLKTREERIADAKAAIERHHAARTAEDVQAIRDAAKERQRIIKLGDKIGEDVIDKDAIWGKDVDIAGLKKLVNDKNYITAYRRANELKDSISVLEKELEDMKDIIPDSDKLHGEFTVEELRGARNAVKSKFDWLERTYPDNYKKQLDKLAFEMDYVEDPTMSGKYPGKVRHRTWKIAQDAYKRKVVEINRKVKITTDLEELRAYQTTSKKFKGFIEQVDDYFAVGDYEMAEKKIAEAQKWVADNESKKVLKELLTGEAKGVKFDDSMFTPEQKKLAKWFKDELNPQNAFNDADKYLSGMTEELWGRLTDEEKMVLYMYTRGSHYINEPIYGNYRRIKYDVNGVARSSEKDINLLTSIIEKAKPLKESMWVQHSEDTEAFFARFGVRLTRNNLDSIIGIEGTNNPFMSTSAAKYSYFSQIIERGLPHTGKVPDVVMSIYLPKGTKGVYCEPFAHFGDGKRAYGPEMGRYGEDGLKWDGKSRQETGKLAGDQVEFLLQRGSKLRITDAEYKDGKWYVECELIEQKELSPVKVKNGSVVG